MKNNHIYYYNWGVFCREWACPGQVRVGGKLDRSLLKILLADTGDKTTPATTRYGKRGKNLGKGLATREVVAVSRSQTRVTKVHPLLVGESCKRLTGKIWWPMQRTIVFFSKFYEGS